jgi:HK97 family phage major capsid protein
MTAQEYRDKANKLATDMKAMLAKAGEEGRELTGEENTQFDSMNTDRDKALAAEERILKVESFDASAGRRAEPSQTPAQREQTKRKLTASDRLEAFRLWLLGGTPEGLNAQQRALAERIGVNPSSKSYSLRLAGSAPKSLRHEDMKEWEERALSTLTGTSPEDGSYLIPDAAMRPLERALLTFGGMRRVATVFRTDTGAALPIPTSDDTGNKGALLAENTQTVEKDVVFGQLVLNAFKFTSKKVLVSVELMQDSATNLAEFLGSALGERIGRITNDYFTTGTGTNEPKGIVTAATSAGVALAAKTPTYAEMVAIEHACDPAYREGGGWMFHDTVFAEIKKIVDASTGRPIWLPSMASGAPETILGYPYTINQSMAVAASTGSGKSILFGQLSKYLVRDVRDIALLRLDELYAEYHQVAFLAFSRSDGDLLDAGTHPVVYAANHA